MIYKKLKIVRLIILANLLLLTTTQLTTAQSNTSSIFRFLSVSPNAHTAGLGGNHTGLYNADFSLLHLNPAYLNAEASGFISASYINFLGDANMGFTSAAYDVENIGTFGIAIRFIGYGEFDHLDEHGNSFGSFHPNDVAITGAYSLSLFDNLTAGAGLDFIHSSYSTYKSSALAFSGGVFYRDTTSHFSAGISIQNLGGQLTVFEDRREPLPLNISAGITKKPEAFPFQLSLTFNYLNNWDMRIFGETEKPDFINNLFRHILFGGEATLGENLAVRLGYDHYLHEQTKTAEDFNLAGLSFGIGFSIKTMTFDFSRNSYSRLGGITRLSIKTNLF